MAHPTALLPPGKDPAEPSPHSFVTRFVRKYLPWIYLLVALVVFSVFWGSHLKATSMVREQLLGQAQAFFSEIVINREWIANQGGVYVRMRPGVESNPWLLKVPGLKVVIRDESGETYTLKNPSLVTREISALAANKGLFRFRITSDRPINPANAPDPFERRSLAEFALGARETSEYEEKDGATIFKYMAPLPVEKSCLRCHGFQGYKEGEIRGGISVAIDATRAERQIMVYQSYLVLSSMGILGIIYGLITVLSRYFLGEIHGAEVRLIEMATCDSLTGLLTRREMLRIAEWERAKGARMERPLTAIMIDIDHFKRVNDTRGHAAGDAVLVALSQVMRAILREYDILCRYGGEEFLAILPEANLEQALSTAERLRKDVEAMSVAVPEGGEDPIRLTVSAGVGLLRVGEKIEELIGRADGALYAAKQEGRNRVCNGG